MEAIKTEMELRRGDYKTSLKQLTTKSTAVDELFSLFIYLFCLILCKEHQYMQEAIILYIISIINDCA